MNRLFTAAALVGALTFGFTSCDKDEEDPIQIEQEYNAKVKVKDGETVQLPFASTTENSEGSIKREGNVYKLRNFRQGIMNSIGTAVVTADATYYFDFKENDATDVKNFVISFDGGSNAIITVNTEENYKLSYIDKDFGSVTKSDPFVAATDNTLALDAVYRGETLTRKYDNAGWANYDVLIHTVTPLNNRTLILLKNNVPYFKFKINSMYSNETPVKPTGSPAPTNFPYYSVDYQEFK